MTVTFYSIVETAIGDCAVLWRDTGLTGVVLPAAHVAAMHASINARAPSAVESAQTGEIKTVILAIQRLCEGEPQTFADVRLDRSGVDPFANRVYAVLEKTPFGETTTYGEIADALGGRHQSRAVGAALGANPFPIIIPCHRVIGANGKLGGFSAPGGSAAKRRLLEIEGAFRPDKLPLFAVVNA